MELHQEGSAPPACAAGLFFNICFVYKGMLLDQIMSDIPHCFGNIYVVDELPESEEDMKYASILTIQDCVRKNRSCVKKNGGINVIVFLSGRCQGQTSAYFCKNAKIGKVEN